MANGGLFIVQRSMSGAESAAETAKRIMTDARSEGHVRQPSHQSCRRQMSRVSSATAAVVQPLGRYRQRMILYDIKNEQG